MKQQCKNHQGLVLLYRIYSGSGSSSPLPLLACFTTLQRQGPLPELALTIDPPPLLDFCASPELRDMVGIAVCPFSPLLAPMCLGFQDPPVLPGVFGGELWVGYGPSLQAVRVCERVGRRVGVGRL